MKEGKRGTTEGENEGAKKGEGQDQKKREVSPSTYYTL